MAPHPWTLVHTCNFAGVSLTLFGTHHEIDCSNSREGIVPSRERRHNRRHIEPNVLLLRIQQPFVCKPCMSGAMSTTSSPESAIDRCQPADATPVALEATALESTAPKTSSAQARTDRGWAGSRRVDRRGVFRRDCSLATQEEVDRIRGYVRGSFLGVGTVTVTVDDVANPRRSDPRWRRVPNGPTARARVRTRGPISVED